MLRSNIISRLRNFAKITKLLEISQFLSARLNAKLSANRAIVSETGSNCSLDENIDQISWKDNPLTIGRRPNNKGSSVERVHSSGRFRID